MTTQPDPVRADGKPALPDGWRWVRLGEICVINPPRPPDLSRPEGAPTSFVPMAAVDERLGAITKAEIRPFAQLRRGYTYFEEGDVLFAKITPCMQNGKHAIARELIDGLGFGTTEFHVLRPSSEAVAEWIHFFVRQPGVLHEATAHFTGAVGQQRVPEGFLANLGIPLPPVGEQKRIVAILAEQMAAVERARAAAQARIEAAKALPAAYLRAALNSPEAARWPRKPLREICAGPGQYGTSVKADAEGQGIPILRMGNLVEGGIRWDDLKCIRLSAAEEDKYRLAEGDILFNRTNSAELVGKTAVFDGGRNAVFASYLIRFRARRGLADPEFISAYINSGQGRAFVAAHMGRAVGQVNISASTMHQMPIPLPPLAYQEAIVDALKKQRVVARSARQVVEAELAAIEALPGAILRRAFSGEL